MDAWAAYRAWMAKDTRTWVDAVPDRARLAWADFEVTVGASTRMADLTVQAVRRFEAFADQRPNQRMALYRNRTPEDIRAALAAGEIPHEHRRTAQTIETQAATMLAFLKFCRVEYGAPIPEGFEFRVAGRNAPGDGPVRYDAWTGDELATIFDPTNLAGFIRRRRENAMRRVGRSTRDPEALHWIDLPWMLLLALYTGARRNEVVGLMVDDIVPEHPETRAYSDTPVPVVVIRENDERGLKTDASTRCVPLHPDLIALGILDLAESRRRAGMTQLLRVPSPVKRGGIWLTDAFADYTKSLGLYVAKRKVFHSFRHTFKTTASGVMDPAQVDALIGHAVQDSTNGTYIHATSVPQHERAEGVGRLRFPVDVAALAGMVSE